MKSSAPVIQVSEESPVNSMPPPSTSKQPPKPEGLRTVSENFLGSDLVPVKSEFSLKRNLDPKDRGRPMVDWIRRQSLQDSGNYSGNPKPLLEVTLEQLQEHNTAGDAWMALRGQVFDVTEYISYHPGGVSEIMRGVGKDATGLFNSIHRYVHFESILKGRQVGIYNPSKGPPNGEAQLDATAGVGKRTGERNSFCQCCARLSGCFKGDGVDSYEDALIPNTKFREDSQYCFYQVDLKGFKYTQDYWSASINSKNTLLLKVVTTPPEMWVGHYKLRETLINDNLDLLFTNRFRTMTVKLEKPRELSWKNIGEALPESNLILDSRHSVEDKIPCTLVLREEIAQSMYLMAFEVSPSARVGVPVGFDVKITALEEGVSRRYTPIPLLFNTSYQYLSKNEVLYFIIKVYPDGKMTQILKKVELQKPGRLQIGFACGNFNSDWLCSADIIFMFAAGSGLTPFIGIIQFFRDHNIAIGVIKLILAHWSKSDKDIVWGAEFKEFEKKKKWFKYVPVLTQVGNDDKSWTGHRGRISDNLLTTIISEIPEVKKKNKSRVRFMTCGPEGFNASVCEAVQGNGYPLDSTFVFLG